MYKLTALFADSSGLFLFPLVAHPFDLLIHWQLCRKVIMLPFFSFPCEGFFTLGMGSLKEATKPNGQWGSSDTLRFYSLARRLLPDFCVKSCPDLAIWTVLLRRRPWARIFGLAQYTNKRAGTPWNKADPRSQALRPARHVPFIHGSARHISARGGMRPKLAQKAFLAFKPKKQKA